MRFGGFVNSPFNSRESDEAIARDYAHGREISATAAARKSDLAKALQEMQNSTQLGIARIHDETVRRGQDLNQPLLDAQVSAMNIMTPLKAESMGLQNEGLGMENKATSKTLAYLDSGLASNQESRALKNLVNRSAAISQLVQNRGALEDAGVDFGGLLEKFGFVRSGASLNNVASNYEENPYVGERRDDDNTYGIDDKPLKDPLFSPVDLLEMIGTFGIGGLIGKASGKAALRKLFSKFGSEAVSKSSAIPQGPVTSTGSRLVGYAAKPWRHGNEPY